MKTFIAFLKKEGTGHIRTGHVTILLILFVIFGIMNPAIAKLTPLMMELLSDSLAESGMIVTDITVDVMASWTQFYKNIPMALIVFVLICCGTLTAECQKGTLIPVLTKGLSRAKVVYAKTVSLALLWSVGYWICYFVTFAYNVYYWDNSIAQHLTLSAVCYYLFGLWIISLVMLFSSFSTANTGVLLGTGGGWVAVYLLSLLPKIQPYTPIRLTESMTLLSGGYKPADFLWASVITLLLIAANIVAAPLIFNKRKL